MIRNIVCLKNIMYLSMSRVIRVGAIVERCEVCTAGWLHINMGLINLFKDDGLFSKDNVKVELHLKE
jgi:hypothetical protein